MITNINSGKEEEKEKEDESSESCWRRNYGDTFIHNSPILMKYQSFLTDIYDWYMYITVKGVSSLKTCLKG